MAGLSPFIAELRADPRTAPAAGDVEAATLALDIEGDGNPDAAACMAAIEAIARQPVSLTERLKALDALLARDGLVAVPRALLNVP